MRHPASRRVTWASCAASGSSAVAETRRTGGKARALIWAMCEVTSPGPHRGLQLEEGGHRLQGRHVVGGDREHLGGLAASGWAVQARRGSVRWRAVGEMEGCG